MATPESPSTQLDTPGRRRAAAIVPAIILASGLLFTGLGVALLLAVEPALLGGIFIAVGLADVAMGIFFRGRFGAAAREAERAAVERGEGAVSPEADPSFNPYARED